MNYQFETVDDVTKERGIIDLSMREIRSQMEEARKDGIPSLCILGHIKEAYVESLRKLGFVVRFSYLGKHTVISTESLVMDADENIIFTSELCSLDFEVEEDVRERLTRKDSTTWEELSREIDGTFFVWIDKEEGVQRKGYDRLSYCSEALDILSEMGLSFTDVTDEVKRIGSPFQCDSDSE